MGASTAYAEGAGAVTAQRTYVAAECDELAHQ